MAKYIEGLVTLDSVDIQGDLYIKPNSKLEVNGDVSINGSLIIEEYGELVAQNVCVCRASLHYSSKVDVLSLTTKSSLMVCRLSFLTVQKETKIGDTLTLEGTMYSHDTNISGKATLRGFFCGRGGVTIDSVSMTDSKLVVSSNLTVKKEMALSDSDLSVLGKVTTKVLRMSSSIFETEKVLNTNELHSSHSHITAPRLVVTICMNIIGGCVRVSNTLVCNKIDIQRKCEMSIKKDMNASCLLVKDSEIKIKGCLRVFGNVTLYENTTTKILGDLTINGDIEILSILEVEGDMMTQGHIHCRESLLAQQTVIANTLTLEDSSSCVINGDLQSEKLYLKTNSSLETRGEMRVTNINENKGTITSNGKLTCESIHNERQIVANDGIDVTSLDNYKNIEMQQDLTAQRVYNGFNGKIILINGSMTVDTLSEGGGSLTVERDLVVTDEMTLDDGSKVTALSLDTSELTINHGSRVVINSHAKVRENAVLGCGSLLRTGAYLAIKGNVLIDSKGSIETEEQIYMLGDASLVLTGCIRSSSSVYIHGCLSIDSNSKNISPSMTSLVTEMTPITPQEALVSIVSGSLFIQEVKKMHRLDTLFVSHEKFIGETNGIELPDFIVLGNGINDKLMSVAF